MANRRQYPDSTDSWNAALVPLIELAIAYVHTYMLNQLVQQIEIENCQDAQVKKIWKLLCQIYAVDNIGFVCMQSWLSQTVQSNGLGAVVAKDVWRTRIVRSCPSY